MPVRNICTCRFVLAAVVTGFVVPWTPAWGQVANEHVKLMASDGAASDFFGWSIDIDHGVVAVGAPRDEPGLGSGSGSAYLFNATNGIQFAKLTPSDGAVGDRFGNAIALSDGVVAVGAVWADNTGAQSGAAYLFDASTGAQTHKLLPSDNAVGDQFGNAIAIDGGIVAVGAHLDDDNGPDSGAVYLFDASTGAEIRKLLPSDGAAGENFGKSVAIDSGIVAVGAFYDDDNGPNSGSAYLFDVSTGAQTHKLLPGDGAAEDRFGFAIDINNGVVAVGAIYNGDNGPNSGSAYLFDASSGNQLLKLLPSDNAANDQFGNSVAIDSGVAVGAHYDDDNNSNSGSAYLIYTPTGALNAKLLPGDGAGGDEFSWSIAMFHGVIAVGMAGDDDQGIDSGSAYVFGRGCPADMTGSTNPFDPGFGVPDFITDSVDFFYYLDRFANGDPAADLTGTLNPGARIFGIPDGIIDGNDFFFYLDLFAAGCP